MPEHAEQLVRMRAQIAALERCIAARAKQDGVLGRGDATALEQMLGRTLDALRARLHEHKH